MSIIRQLNIEVPDLVAAKKDYQKLLGQFTGKTDDSFQVGGITIELIHNPHIDAAKIVQTELYAPSQQTSSSIEANPTFILSTSKPAQHRPGYFKHLAMIVLMTNDIAQAENLLSNTLELPLKRRLVLKENNTQLLFYESGPTTLEVAQDTNNTNEKKYFWGLGFYTDNIDTCHQALSDQGVTLSEIRQGQKRGTRVATIKSHHLGLPTLLVGPAH